MKTLEEAITKVLKSGGVIEEVFGPPEQEAFLKSSILNMDRQLAILAKRSQVWKDALKKKELPTGSKVVHIQDTIDFLQKAVDIL
jgi:hypothetical protein